MKKVLSLIGISLFLIILFSFILLRYSINEMKKENTILSKKIVELNANYENDTKENDLEKERINSIKESNEEALKEKEVWERAKRKLKDALS